MTLKVMTYNICSCHNLNHEYDPGGTIAFIKGEAPDILGVNEVDYMNERGFFTDMPKIMAEKLDYPYYFFGKTINYRGGEYGNCLFSKHPIVDTKNIKIPETGGCEDRAVIKAVINIADKPAAVMVSHYGLSEAERVNAAALTAEQVKKAMDLKYPVIFMGDLNCPPNAEELRSLYGLLNDTAERSSDRLLSFPSDDPKEKIDYIFVSSEFKTENVYLRRTQASDHLPYTVILSY